MESTLGGLALVYAIPALNPRRADMLKVSEKGNTSVEYQRIRRSRVAERPSTHTFERWGAAPKNCLSKIQYGAEAMLKH